ncbi:ESX secretion-associated protein EspG [Rhodococcus daqingensis]|uniref:ESX secretion-associated protein EspG n=1 Tax=Rhodococcus daqingensis TaxID=2479363 RepID=A0ABW2RTE7_9NOCA
MRWNLSPDEFDHAWREAGLGRFPYPLEVQRTVDGPAAHARALSDWYEGYRSAELAVALGILAKPSLRVEIFGVEGSAAVSDGLPAAVSDGRLAAEWDGRPAAVVRVLGCASERTSVVVAQRPGLTADTGGDLAMCLGGVETLAQRIVDMLPGAEPGGRRAMTAPAPEVRGGRRSSLLVPVRSATTAARIRALLDRPRTGVGQVVVTSGLDRPGTPSSGAFSWIDVSGDGRYLVRTGSAVEIRPLSVAGFAAELRAELPATF